MAYKAPSSRSKAQYNFVSTSRMKQINIWILALFLAIAAQLSLAADNGKDENIYCKQK